MYHWSPEQLFRQLWYKEAQWEMLVYRLSQNSLSMKVVSVYSSPAGIDIETYPLNSIHLSNFRVELKKFTQTVWDSVTSGWELDCLSPSPSKCFSCPSVYTWVICFLLHYMSHYAFITASLDERLYKFPAAWKKNKHQLSFDHKVIKWCETQNKV